MGKFNIGDRVLVDTNLGSTPPSFEEGIVSYVVTGIKSEIGNGGPIVGTIGDTNLLIQLESNKNFFVRSAEKDLIRICG